MVMKNKNNKGFENQYLVPDIEKVFRKYSVQMGDASFTLHTDMLSGYFSFASSLHSIILSYFDTQRALKELQSVYYYQRFDGAVPLMLKTGRRLPGRARLFYLLFSRMFDDSGMTHLVGPPMGLYALARLSSNRDTAKSLKELLPFAQREIYFMENTRELWGEGLPAIIHPLESGFLLSDVYDDVLDVEVKGKMGFYRQLLQMRSLLRVAEDAEWGNMPTISDTPFRFIDPLFCTVYLAGLNALKKSDLKMDASMQEHLKKKVQTITASVEERLWSDEYECYLPHYFHDGWKPVNRITIASILMLFTGMIDKSRAEQMVNRYLMPGYGFWQHVPLSGGIVDDCVKKELRQYRGCAVNPVFNWMIYHGLLKYGYTDMAERLRKATVELVENSGLYTWYDHVSGKGIGRSNSPLSGIVLDF